MLEKRRKDILSNLDVNLKDTLSKVKPKYPNTTPNAAIREEWKKGRKKQRSR